MYYCLPLVLLLKKFSCQCASLHFNVFFGLRVSLPNCVRFNMLPHGLVEPKFLASSLTARTQGQEWLVTFNIALEHVQRLFGLGENIPFQYIYAALFCISTTARSLKSHNLP